MQMIILAQSATNSISQFVRIVLKILAQHSYNYAKLFLDNLKVKRRETTYKNRKLAPRIKQYVIKHIKNLNKVLANLE